jgi:small subunit ribosomal protein S7
MADDNKTPVLPATEPAPAPKPVETTPPATPPATASAPAPDAKPAEAPAEVPLETAEEQPPAPPEKPAPKFNLPLLFGRYAFDSVVVKDLGLVRYINTTAIGVPHTQGKYANKPFSRQKVNIVERLINGMMRTEHGTGEKARAYKMVRDAFRIIEEKTKQNPIQILVDAIEKASPREEVTRLRYGGISVPKAVDTSSYRRVNIALKNICQGVINASSGNRKRIEQCLADELMAAARGDVNSHSIGKKGEVERVAASAR